MKHPKLITRTQIKFSDGTVLSEALSHQVDSLRKFRSEVSVAHPDAIKILLTYEEKE